MKKLTEAQNAIVIAHNLIVRQELYINLLRNMLARVIDKSGGELELERKQYHVLDSVDFRVAEGEGDIIYLHAISSVKLGGITTDYENILQCRQALKGENK